MLYGTGPVSPAEIAAEFVEVSCQQGGFEQFPGFPDNPFKIQHTAHQQFLIRMVQQREVNLVMDGKSNLPSDASNPDIGVDKVSPGIAF